MPAPNPVPSGSRPGSRALVACVGASLVMTVLGGVVDGTRGMISVAGAALLVLAYFVSGQIVERQALQMADATGMTITMAAYAVRIALVGVVLWFSMSNPAVSALLSSTWVAIGALTAVIAWLTGLMISHAKARVPIYDKPYQAPAGWDE